MSSISCDSFLTLDSNKLFKKFFTEAKERLRVRKLSVTHSLAPTTSSCQLGHLSRLGSVQHLTLGSLLGQHYSKRMNLNSNKLKVYSTPYSRTFQSAVAFVYGFLKPMTIIDFKSFPQIATTFGTFFCSSSEFCLKRCKKLEVLHKILNDNKRQTLSLHPAVVRLLDNLKPIVANSANESRVFESPIALFDGLMAYLCHNSALPCDEKRCVTVEDVKQLISYIEFHGKQLVVSEVFKHSNWLKIYGFLNHLITRINDLENKQKFYLFSGHDITIVALASALDFFDGTLPPLASRVIFETYRHSFDDNIYLRIIYNGKDVTRYTEICKLNPSKCLAFDTKHRIHLITAKHFNQFIENKFKSFTQTSNYENACNS